MRFRVAGMGLMEDTTQLVCALLPASDSELEGHAVELVPPRQ